MTTTHLAYIEIFYKSDGCTTRRYLADETYPVSFTEFPVQFGRRFPSTKEARDALTAHVRDSIYEPGTTSYGYVKLHTVPVNDAGDYPVSNY